MTIDTADREALRNRGAALRERLDLPADLHAELAPGLSALFDELVFGALWGRPGLALEDRMVATLASLAALERSSVLAAYAAAAPRLGVSPAAVREVVLQAGLYTGFVAAEVNLAAVNAVSGDTPDPADAGPAGDADLLALGTTVMESLHGARARGGYASGGGAPAALYDLAMRYGYGVLWNRPALPRRQRFVTAIAVFTSLEQAVQLTKFAASAAAHGIDRDAAIEVIMQVAPYAGFPRALNALSALDAG